jgi:DNA ligase (NAD+)
MKIFTVSRVAGFMCLWLLSALVATGAEPGPLQPEAARERMVLLRSQVAYHDELYYKKSAPEITDAAYDALKRELSVLEQQFPALVAGISPTDSLGDDRNGTFQLYRHRERMQSLAKSYAESELRGFHTRLGQQLGRNDLVYVIEPKFDGLAVSVTYEKGRLVRAVTRGNGVEGDDVTANALTIAGLPRELRANNSDGAPNPVPEAIELRGEIFLPWAEFRRINGEREAAGERLPQGRRARGGGRIAVERDDVDSGRRFAHLANARRRGRALR